MSDDHGEPGGDDDTNGDDGLDGQGDGHEGGRDEVDPRVDGAPNGAGDPAAGSGGDSFERELERARALLADAQGSDTREAVSALHVGVVRGDRVDSTAARRSEGERAGLETLALLASHVRTVAEEAGVDYETVAADAAQLAGEVEGLPTGGADTEVAGGADSDTGGDDTDTGDAADGR